MTPRKRTSEKTGTWSIAPLAISLVAVFGLTFVVAKLGGGELIAWAVVSQFIGVATFLCGVVGLVHCAWSTTHGDLSKMGGHLALVLAGAILVGGGWGAALGLGLLGSTALFLAHRRNDDGGEPSE